LNSASQQLQAHWFQNPNDASALAILADLWVEQGDPRGEFVQLALLSNPTEEQLARKASLEKKQAGKLVGPARPHLREWSFGANGIVERARCEADKLIEGIGEIGQLNPFLALCVTSLKKVSTAKALATISLAPIYHVAFTPNIIGSLGGSNLTDKTLSTIGPAFRGVKNISLMARGFQDGCFSPAGLAHFAMHLQGVEFFGLDYYTTASEGKHALAPLDEYVEVISKHAAFQMLKAVHIFGAQRAQLARLPNVKSIVVDQDVYKMPVTHAQMNALKVP
jgi:hypothetical protein